MICPKSIVSPCRCDDHLSGAAVHVPHDSCDANDQTPGYETMTSMGRMVDAGW